jgi:hypothetical protein
MVHSWWGLRRTSQNSSNAGLLRRTECTPMPHIGYRDTCLLRTPSKTSQKRTSRSLRFYPALATRRCITQRVDEQ